MPFDGTDFGRSKEADALRRARALIDKPEKWGKGCGLRDPERGHCVITAIYAQPTHIRLGADKIFSEANGIPHGNIYPWNDAPERTHAEVMAAFDKAIALADERAAASRSPAEER